MPLSNAERQRRFRERHQSDPAGAGALTAEQRAARDAVMSEPIWPVPAAGVRDQMPTFMGWGRYDWSVAPLPLIEFFGMCEARDGWDAERRAMDEAMARNAAAHRAKADRIVAECGEVARGIIQEGRHDAVVRHVQGQSGAGAKAAQGKKV